MKLFGLNIETRNKKEQKEQKETKEVDYITPYTEGLLFGQIRNISTSMAISAVFRAVEIISDSIAILPVRVKMKNEKHNDTVESHSINIALDNGIISRYNLMKLVVQSLLIKGNGFIYIERTPDGTVYGLRFLENNEVTINYNKETGELNYTCKKISKKPIQPKDMIHLVKSSYNGINGVPVINFANRTIEIANATENSAKSYFSNGCNLAGVLSVTGQLSQDQRNQIRNSWNSAYTGGGQGLAILQGNMQYQNVQSNASDAQMLETRLYNLQDIARFFGINPILLGDLSNSSYSTLEAVQSAFVLQTLQPYITLIEEEFTRKLFGEDESDYFIELDTTILIKTDKQVEASYYKSLLECGVLCIDEVRERMGLSPIEGGDKHTVAYTDISQNTINKENNNDGDEGKDKSGFQTDI